jgi:hypothetical protein
MKNIAYFEADKYKTDKNYTLAEEGIYLFSNPPDAVENGRFRYGNMTTSEKQPGEYVTSLAFEQEPELGEGESPSNISQYPLEDILDEFDVYVSDFYEDLNAKSEKVCYQEFSSPDIEDVRNLRSIIGKHVYDNGEKLVIE